MIRHTRLNCIDFTFSPHQKFQKKAMNQFNFMLQYLIGKIRQ